MKNISSQRSILEIASASTRAWAMSAGTGRTFPQHSGRVVAGYDALFQGTGLPFAGRGADSTDGTAVRDDVPSGTTTWGPPV